MKLSSGIANTMQIEAKAYVLLKEKFLQFIASAKALQNPSERYAGLQVHESSDMNHIDVSFLGLTFRFKFSVARGERTALVGRIHVLTPNDAVPGAFTIIHVLQFDGNGRASFETEDGPDKYDVHSCGDAIVLNAFDQALG